MYSIHCVLYVLNSICLYWMCFQCFQCSQFNMSLLNAFSQYSQFWRNVYFIQCVFNALHAMFYKNTPPSIYTMVKVKLVFQCPPALMSKWVSWFIFLSAHYYNYKTWTMSCIFKPFNAILPKADII